MTSAPQLAAIWRYPVKSLQGEPLTTATVEGDGLLGDRRWGIRDEATGRILTARREPPLLLASATVDPDGEPVITLPDGASCRGAGPETDDLLSDWLGNPVTLVASSGGPGGNAEYFADPTDDSSQAIEWTMPPGRFVDSMALLVLTTASLRALAALHPDGEWDVRRFRPNLLVDTDADGWVEDGWAGHAMRVGDAEIVPRAGCVRCTMVTRPQPGLDRDLDIYKTISRYHGGTLGMWTQVVTPGPISVGQPLELAS